MNITEEDYEIYKMVTSSEDWVDVSCMGASYIEYVNIITGQSVKFESSVKDYLALVQ